MPSEETIRSVTVPTAQHEEPVNWEPVRTAAIREKCSRSPTSTRATSRVPISIWLFDICIVWVHGLMITALPCSLTVVTSI